MILSTALTLLMATVRPSNGSGVLISSNKANDKSEKQILDSEDVSSTNGIDPSEGTGQTSNQSAEVSDISTDEKALADKIQQEVKSFMSDKDERVQESASSIYDKVESILENKYADKLGELKKVDDESISFQSVYVSYKRKRISDNVNTVLGYIQNAGILEDHDFKNDITQLRKGLKEINVKTLGTIKPLEKKLILAFSQYAARQADVELPKYLNNIVNITGDELKFRERLLEKIKKCNICLKYISWNYEYSLNQIKQCLMFTTEIKQLCNTILADGDWGVYLSSLEDITPPDFIPKDISKGNV
jgi:hypothetical protein